MSGDRYVIINADDLGLSVGVNKGIADAHDHGIVTSASLMVLGPGAEQAAQWARSRPGLSVGIHIDICDFEFRDHEWNLLYERASLDDPAAVATEVVNQLRRFEELMGGPPTHIDCHQHIHRGEPARSVIMAEAAAVGVPLRDHSPATYVGGFYGQTNVGEPLPELITGRALAGLLRSLPPGWSELACHAGYAEDTNTSYRSERRTEVDALCDPLVRTTIKQLGIELRTFRELPCG